MFYSSRQVQDVMTQIHESVSKGNKKDEQNHLTLFISFILW